jgi:hypothetical protein
LFQTNNFIGMEVDNGEALKIFLSETKGNYLFIHRV